MFKDITTLLDKFKEEIIDYTENKTYREPQITIYINDNDSILDNKSNQSDKKFKTGL
jgi:hypothetical protein